MNTSNEIKVLDILKKREINPEMFINFEHHLDNTPFDDTEKTLQEGAYKRSERLRGLRELAWTAEQIRGFFGEDIWQKIEDLSSEVAINAKDFTEFSTSFETNDRWQFVAYARQTKKDLKNKNWSELDWENTCYYVFPPVRTFEESEIPQNPVSMHG